MSRSGRPCRYGNDCPYGDCPHQHPPGRDVDRAKRETHLKPCNAQASCYRPECPFGHPPGVDAAARRRNYENRACNNDPDCDRPDCHFAHPVRDARRATRRGLQGHAAPAAAAAPSHAAVAVEQKKKLQTAKPGATSVHGTATELAHTVAALVECVGRLDESRAGVPWARVASDLGQQGIDKNARDRALETAVGKRVVEKDATGNVRLLSESQPCRARPPTTSASAAAAAPPAARVHLCLHQGKRRCPLPPEQTCIFDGLPQNWCLKFIKSGCDREDCEYVHPTRCHKCSMKPTNGRAFNSHLKAHLKAGPEPPPGASPAGSPVAAAQHVKHEVEKKALMEAHAELHAELRAERQSREAAEKQRAIDEKQRDADEKQRAAAEKAQRKAEMEGLLASFAQQSQAAAAENARQLQQTRAALAAAVAGVERLRVEEADRQRKAAAGAGLADFRELERQAAAAKAQVAEALRNKADAEQKKAAAERKVAEQEVLLLLRTKFLKDVVKSGVCALGKDDFADNACMFSGKAFRLFDKAVKAATGKSFLELLGEDKEKVFDKFEIGFHGTKKDAVPLILCDGFDPKRRSGQVYGPGEYFDCNFGVSAGYTAGNGGIIGTLILKDPTRVSRHTYSGGHPIWVVNNPTDGSLSLCLPVFVLSDAAAVMKTLRCQKCKVVAPAHCDPTVAAAAPARPVAAAPAAPSAVAMLFGVRDDQGIFAPFDAALQSTFAQSRSSPQRVFQYHANGARYQWSADPSAPHGVQQNLDSGKRRPIVVVQGLRVFGDSGVQVIMDPQTTATIFGAVISRQTTVKYTVGKHQYDLDLRSMVQRNIQSGVERAVVMF